MNLRTGSGRKAIPKRVWEDVCGTGKQQESGQARMDLRTGSGRKAIPKRVWEDVCGTGKQQESGQARMDLRTGSGRKAIPNRGWEDVCGTGIGEKHMKKIGLLHGELSKTLAELAHEDRILIGDAGMPVPEGVKMIDLAVVQGVPAFIDVLKAVMGEMLVAKGIIDLEQETVSPQMRQKVVETVGDAFPLEILPHAQVKELSRNVKAVIRTGEFTPYANIILEADCLF